MDLGGNGIKSPLWDLMVVNLWPSTFLEGKMSAFLAFYLIWRKQIEMLEKAFFAEIESAGTNFSAGSSACFAQKCRPVNFFFLPIR